MPPLAHCTRSALHFFTVPRLVSKPTKPSSERVQAVEVGTRGARPLQASFVDVETISRAKARGAHAGVDTDRLPVGVEVDVLSHD